MCPDKLETPEDISAKHVDPAYCTVAASGAPLTLLYLALTDRLYADLSDPTETSDRQSLLTGSPAKVDSPTRTSTRPSASFLTNSPCTEMRDAVSIVCTILHVSFPKQFPTHEVFIVFYSCVECYFTEINQP